MKVEIWSDVVCPWCYVGKRNFEAALAAFEHRDEIEVVWRSYELDPNAPAEREGTYADRIARKYGLDPGAARARLASMTSTAAGVGLDFKFDIARFGNTFDAHRVIHHAATRGLQAVVKERLLRAIFTEGEPIGSRDALVRLAVEAGLDEAEVVEVLETGACTRRKSAPTSAPRTRTALPACPSSSSTRLTASPARRLRRRSATFSNARGKTRTRAWRSSL